MVRSRTKSFDKLPKLKLKPSTMHNLRGNNVEDDDFTNQVR
jgi:hypothetical protein